MKENVTIWYRKNKSGEYEHNHLEYGHSEHDKPTPLFESQKVWNSCDWKKKLTIIENGVVGG